MKNILLFATISCIYLFASPISAAAVANPPCEKSAKKNQPVPNDNNNVLPVNLAATAAAVNELDVPVVQNEIKEAEIKKVDSEEAES